MRIAFGHFGGCGGNFGIVVQFEFALPARTLTVPP
jgi:hypothetical protein